MTKLEARAILLKAAADLGEYFGAVQIHASWMAEDGSGRTEGDHAGCGDWYARYGLTQEFIDRGKAWEIGSAVARASEE